jgi:vancomycin resistance protein YoaR
LCEPSLRDHRSLTYRKGEAVAQSSSREHGPATVRSDQTNRPRTRTRRRHWGLWLLPFILAGLLVLALVSIVAAYQYEYRNRIYPGVQIAGINVGGLSLDQAATTLKEGLTPYPGPPVVLQYGDRSWALSPSDLGVAVDGVASAAQAYAVGREGATAAVAAPRGDWRAYLGAQWQGLETDLFSQWYALRDGQALDPVLTSDAGQINYHMLRIAREVDLAPQEASLTVSGLDVITTTGRSGRQVDLDASRAALLAAAQAGRGGTVELPVAERQPVVTSVDDAANRARTLLSQPLTLVAQGAGAAQRFAVDRATLRQWLQIAPLSRSDGTMELRVEVDQDLVTGYLQQIAAQIDHPMQNASLDFDPKTRQVKVVTPSQVGQQLDQAAAAASIASALTGDGPREILLPVIVLQPKIDSSKVAEMGITELVSEATTNFAGSSSGRVHNVANAASKFNNVVIPPGAVFSFNEHVGDITVANGFVDSLIIAGDRTEVGVGGGVCQVSTTAFQAAVRGGFPIVERWAHSYVVGYYGKPGLDATIYTPDVDFRFKNDTDHYLLIKTETNTAKSSVTFRFYGTKPDRTVEISEPVISNVTTPEKPVYKEDVTLAAGTIKQVDWANNGEQVVVVRTVRNADGTAKQDRFVSKYQAWRAVFLYGPGTRLPPGAVDSPAPATDSGQANG